MLITALFITSSNEKLQKYRFPSLSRSRAFLIKLFCKPKWLKVKKQLPLIYMGKFLSSLAPKK